MGQIAVVWLTSALLSALLTVLVRVIADHRIIVFQQMSPSCSSALHLSFSLGGHTYFSGLSTQACQHITSGDSDNTLALRCIDEARWTWVEQRCTN